MKAATLRVTTVMAMVLALTTVTAYAQTASKKQTFVVPFQFKIGQKVLPAGAYAFAAESQTIQIRSKDGKHHLVVIPLRTITAKLSGAEVKLTFRRDGDHYSLSQVWLADGLGREIRRQRHTDSNLAQTRDAKEVSGSTR